MFQLHAPFAPCGDQSEAIAQLSAGVHNQIKSQVLLGATGSGKTFTIANVVANVNLPTLVLAHNKTLAAQLYQEFREFFPNNAVEYFISYYDYYQPEAYIARSDTYIEKSLLINDEIDKLRLSATRSILERRDTLIVSSVSCIYGIGSPENYTSMALVLEVGKEYSRNILTSQLVKMHYQASSIPQRSAFRERGSVIDIFPAYESNLVLRLEFINDILASIEYSDPLTMIPKDSVSSVTLYPGSHYVTPEAIREQAIRTIQEELEERMAFFEDRPIEKERIFQRTTHDIEMIKEIGFCKGIENYSRHFTGAPSGAPPTCLLDYFPEDFLLVVDESHQTLPQIRAMYRGDLSRKQSLVEYGFRLPSAFDNRPLTYEEAQRYFRKVIYVSATPGETELQESVGHVIQQIIRPTGIPDPIPEIRPATGQVDDLLEEIRIRLSQKHEKILVISITKKLAEDMAGFLSELEIPAAYLHSGIETAERTQILADLRSGVIDVLIGVNLLREGLDLPEVSLVAILDADKEGFLRSTSSLIQFCGRAARNINGKVIFYADQKTRSIEETLKETERRRQIQLDYNKKHNIVPKPIIKAIFANPIIQSSSKDLESPKTSQQPLSKEELEEQIKKYEKLMQRAAKEFRFDAAAKYRDQMQACKEQLLYFF
ncbi:Excinuclease ABC subunit B,excinuclease ABC subunit B,Predicted HKD family nuclease,excinuclease ABC subunit B,Ultra-violet resistance protein B [Chlamydia serpentis]|uniref:UvrABC system protein B n=1 Tax=Chlamydia serpentis TaxID=1967782 RepID=A0A2R8FBY5_9CHLA|nr:excinuclease ABC subunit UvrB [Chlamydia serpentis]SPN73913.1 Excinuclease ABC subunit B,excinuclease ABC subunit B,Predicted HKD family nuclease,excinuclease ABC subunit B,Ultra-violet resistance protein B [Chlamydia serpentis]